MLNKKFRQILSVLLCFILVSNILPSAAFAAEGVVIDETTFPDAVFREYVIKELTNGDNILSQNELEQTTDIYLYSYYHKISNLKGIEYFSNLETLDCSGNQLTSLDLSSNTALTHLECANNQLTSLDLSNNTALT